MMYSSLDFILNMALLFSGVDPEIQETKAQNYRPAYLDHFEKLEENQRNMGSSRRKQDNVIRTDGAVQFPKNFVGPMDFDFVSSIFDI